MRGASLWRAASTSIRRVPFVSTTNLTRDGELGGIFAILAKKVREQAATCIDEPVTYLQHGEVGLARQAEFLLLRRVSVEAVFVQPAPQNLNRLFGQVTAATALPKEPSS